MTVLVERCEDARRAGDAPEPVVCIHGTSIADSLITPLRFYPPLMENYQLISYSRAGCNGSTLKTAELSIEGGAEHVKQLLDHLGIEKVYERRAYGAVQLTE
ncbi:hypothetical protein SAMN05216276_100930 [Streptosporangium subroseum]|uniref:Uncharacterized protein n=1 Tax=Streptosporangium subroseum TaxID=106412 RepID=A0A239E987_9ACTN|nr:alpha/beta hydrolase [Streptosporangium subroseum]SNS41186.1 hypothetical protein SAMN05216276_100930 [Streptosporangium subroseum]